MKSVRLISAFCEVMETAGSSQCAAEVPSLDAMCLLINESVEALLKAQEPNGPGPKVPMLHNQDMQHNGPEDVNDKRGLFAQRAELSNLFKHIRDNLGFPIPIENGTDEDVFMQYRIPDPKSLHPHFAVSKDVLQELGSVPATRSRFSRSAALEESGESCSVRPGRTGFVSCA
ncbi:hypothetical protein NDU88_002387 [Pleurodeles waltl]|uniref:Uncharacterized protein n=1 Tax=Pleurodeles waltl TaxID=8319 RepID=A0AAV7SBG3_PLEWA|nr:hypothetical protein NDU88_002387 [Pleurodeles waltl]